MKPFNTPGELRKYILATSSLLKCEGYEKAALLLETKARLPCTSGWEWLGEIALGILEVQGSTQTPEEITKKLEIILATAKSNKPYGQRNAYQSNGR